MKLLRYTAPDGLRWGAATERGLVDLSHLISGAHGAVHKFLPGDGRRRLEDAAESGTAIAALGDIDYAPFLPDPEKIFCVGVNYGERNAEYKDGSEAPKYPSLFLRTPDTFVGHRQNLIRPLGESEQLDYEGEIVIVIGKGGRRIPREDALSHIAGLTLMNEGSVRDWLRHAKFNVTQGKNFHHSGSIGPWMVMAETLDFAGLDIQTRVNGEMRQSDSTNNLLFSFEYLISYISSFAQLKPGDLISTGTPTGAGARFDPPKYLAPGDVIEVSCPQIGVLINGVADG